MPVSVVVPAHNEAAVIKRCLSSMIVDAPDDNFPEIVVVCNGCTDDTAALAKSVDQRIRVINLTEGSKILAINTGVSEAEGRPVFVVDADVVVSWQALKATADALDNDGIEIGSPRLVADTTGCDRFVRSFYTVWALTPYANNNMVGSGVFGLSETALQRVGRLPPVIADDGYVRMLFATNERCNVGEANPADPNLTFTIYPPRTVGDLIAIEARRRAGDAELEQFEHLAAPQVANSAGSLFGLVGNGATLRDVVTYMAIKIAGRLLFRWNRLRGRAKIWTRDESSRTVSA